MVNWISEVSDEEAMAQAKPSQSQVVIDGFGPVCRFSHFIPMHCINNYNLPVIESIYELVRTTGLN
jgi:hypothetical protein